MTDRLTITDPTAASVDINTSAYTSDPTWTVYFSSPPAEPGDPGGPQISGTPQVGQRLDVADVGNVFDDTECAGLDFKYRWLRDGDAIAENPFRVANLDMGGSSRGLAYRVSAADLGHRLSVRVSCADADIEVRSDPTTLVTTTVPEQPAAQFLLGASTYSSADGSAKGGRFSGVVGDPTNPTMPIYLAQGNSAGTALVDPSELTVAASVTYPDYVTSQWRGVTPADVLVTGNGALRTVAVDADRPDLPGHADLDGDRDYGEDDDDELSATPRRSGRRRPAGCCSARATRRPRSRSVMVT